MPLKNFRPITPGTRNAVRASFEELTARKPEKSLISRKKNTPDATTGGASPPRVAAAARAGCTAK